MLVDPAFYSKTDKNHTFLLFDLFRAAVHLLLIVVIIVAGLAIADSLITYAIKYSQKCYDILNSANFQ